jgi:hypothetical protein
LKRFAAILLLTSWLVEGCTPARFAASAAPPELSAGQQVARLLIMGDEAINANERSAAAARLMAIGAHPATASDQDLASAWRGPTGSSAAGPVYRGRMLGPAYRRGFVGAGSFVTIEQLFLAGSEAEVVVSPLRAAQLDLAISDTGGQVVCRSAVIRPTARCSWRPPFSGRYQLRITNNGPAEANYFLVIN